MPNDDTSVEGGVHPHSSLLSVSVGWSVKKRPAFELSALALTLTLAFVPEIGVEPIHPCGRQILSLLRLPIPPPGREDKSK
jgi:hypothetical protein